MALLYSTGNSTLYSVMNYVEKNLKRMDTAETNNTVNQLHTLIKIKNAVAF